jgi:phage protein D
VSGVLFLAPAYSLTLDGTPLPPSAEAAVSDISVTQQPGTLDQFTLSLANDFPDLPWTHAESDRLAEGKSVEIKMGYVDKLEKLFDGEITGVSAEFPDSGMPTVRVTGHSLLHRLQRNVSTRTFKDMTDAEIVTQVAQGVSLSADTDSTETKHPYVLQYNQTDLAFLLDRARRIRFEVYVEDKTLVFRKARDASGKALTLLWGDPQRAVDPDNSVFPLRTFSVTVSALRQVSKVKVRGQDPKTREVLEAEKGEGDEDKTMGAVSGPKLADKAFGGPAEASVVASPVASLEEADQIAEALYNERALGLVSGNGTTIGTTKLRAGSIVELGGLGPRLNGLYYITEATHRVGQSGYETTFSARRNAVG